MFKDKNSLIINVGLSIVIVLLITMLSFSLYQLINGEIDSKPSGFLRDPQVIAVAIGLIISVLFVDRWKSMERQVENLRNEQEERLKSIEKFANDQAKLKIGQMVDKAEKVNANLTSISERHPWLDVITERDIIVETDSVRGILRTSYNLLRDGKYLHLYEYLEYCSRKGTKQDIRDENKRTPLRGTAEDFLEIASFCEVWLEDYALSTEFLKLYISHSGDAAYIMYPDYIRRLLRIGALSTAQMQARQLIKVLAWANLHRKWPFIISPYPISERYYWHALNSLSLVFAAIGNNKRSAEKALIAQSSSFAHLYKTQQTLFNVERLVYIGQFTQAFSTLENIDGQAIAVTDVRHLVLLLENLGANDRAALLRKRIINLRSHAHGDDWLATGNIENEHEQPPQPEQEPPQAEQQPPQPQPEQEPPQAEQQPPQPQSQAEQQSSQRQPDRNL